VLSGVSGGRGASHGTRIWNGLRGQGIIRSINAEAALNGHPVNKLIVMTDGGDSAPIPAT